MSAIFERLIDVIACNVEGEDEAVSVFIPIGFNPSGNLEIVDGNGMWVSPRQKLLFEANRSTLEGLCRAYDRSLNAVIDWGKLQDWREVGRREGSMAVHELADAMEKHRAVIARNGGGLVGLWLPRDDAERSEWSAICGAFYRHWDTIAMLTWAFSAYHVCKGRHPAA